MKITCCPGCGSNFSTWGASSKTPNKQPLVLKCGHTFCESCLIPRTKKVTASQLHQAQVTCLTCKNVTLLENGVKDLPVNIYLSAYIEINQRGKLDQQLGSGLGQFVPAGKLVRSFSDFETKCKMCVAKTAICKCVECDNLLCIVCFEKIHSMSAAIKHHRPVPVSLSQLPENEFEPKCAEHNRILEYFCEDDSSSICSRCYIVGKHQNHSIISIEEKNKQVFEDIANELPKARLVLQHLNRIDKKIVSAIPNVKIETKSVIENINQSFMVLHSLIQAREMEIISEVYLAYKCHLMSIEQKRETFEKTRCELEDVMKKSSKLLENNSLLLDGHALLTSLRKAQTTPCIPVKMDVSEEPLRWHEPHDNLRTIISAYGSILGVPPLKLDFKKLDEVSEHAEDDDKDKINMNSHSSESSVPSMRGAVSAYGNILNANIGEDVEIENGDAANEPDISKGIKEIVRENVSLPVVKGPAQKVMVTHIRSPNDFCVQLVSNKRQLETLAHNINTWCHRNGSVKHIPLSLEKEMMVLARYSGDKQWYRAKVLSVEKPAEDKDDNYKVHVKYIDFGNDELLPIKELRLMQKRFMKYPVFSVQCSLFDIAPLDEDQPWSVESIKEFHRMTQNQVLLMTALNMQGAVYEVDLSCIPMADAMDDNYVSVRDILIFLELARFRTFSDAATKTSAPPSYTKIDYIKSTSVKNGQTLGIIVTQVTSPYNIHLVCTGEEHDYYLTMHDEMQQMYCKDLCNIYSLFYPRKDMVCAARGNDDQWHRAKVTSSPVHQQVTVSLVDLGKTETVHYDCLKKLHSSFIKLPIQAVPCQLVDVCPIAGPTSQWSDEAKFWCIDNLTDTNGQARFIRCGQDTQIVLWLDNIINVPGTQSINSALVEQGFAQSTGPSSLLASKESQISPDSFLYRDGDFNPRRDYSKEIVNASAIGAKKLNKVTLSPVPLKKKSPQRYPMPQSLKKLNKFSGAFSKSQKSLQINKKTSPKARKVSKIQNSSEEKKRIQQEIHNAMSTDGSSITDTVYIEVIVCNYVSPSEFYVQIQETRDDLTNLMKDMQAAFAVSQPHSVRKWSVNEYCASKYSSDGLWCRANILSKMADEKYEVEYVDFGNLDLVNASDLRQLPPEFGSRIPCAAARCYLADVMPAGSMNITGWSQTASEFVASLLRDRKLYIKQDGEPTELGLPVDLIMEDEIPETAFEPRIQCYQSVRKEVIKNGLAIPIKKSSVLPPLNTSARIPLQKFVYKGADNSSAHLMEQGDNIDFNENSLPHYDPDNLQTDVTGSETEDQNLDEASREIMPSQAETFSLPPYPLLQLGVEVAVVPTYVDKDGIIYVQPMFWEGKCVHLSSELQRIYGQMLPVVNKEWKVGQMCVALFSDDGFWYRSLIEEIKDDVVKILYTDFGNSSWVKSSCLMEMLPAFAKEHALAYRCVLHDLETISQTKVWPVEVLDYIHKLIVNQRCTIMAVESDEGTPIKIQLFKDDVNLCEDLISKNMAVSCLSIKTLCEQSNLIAQVLTNQNPYHALEIGDVGDTFRALMVHAELPDVIYLQRGLEIEPEETDFVKASEVAEINNGISEFVSMAERLKSCKLLTVSHLPDVGLMCAALFSADDQLYRALCVQRYPETDSCMVLFVDYGTSEIVPRNRLKLLPSEFWSVPAQAVRCNISVSSLTTSARQLSHHSFSCAIKCLMERELMARILNKNPLTVELMVEEDGEWLIPYKHVFDDIVETPSSLSVLINDGITKSVDDTNITLYDLKGEMYCKENWNGEDDADSFITPKKEIAKVEAAEDSKGGSAKSKKVISPATGSNQPEKLRKEITVEAEDVSNRKMDDDDVDWVAIAAKLVEDTHGYESVKEPSKEVCKNDSTTKESGEKSTTVRGETMV